MEDMGEMERMLIWYLPLSSLRSFAGIDNEEIQALVKEMKMIVE